MSSTRKNPLKANLAAVAAFGIVSLGAVSLAGAHPTSTPYPQPKPIAPGHYDDSYDRPDYDLDDDGVIEHVELDYRHYDRNRDGVLDLRERTAYWEHMFDMGKYGEGFSSADKARLARIAPMFDTDRDGRLTQSERRALSRLIRARKAFIQLDRNRDNNVTRREARLVTIQPYPYYGYPTQVGGSYDWTSANLFYRGRHAPQRFAPNNWVAQRFQILDRNDNGRVSWNEVEAHLIVSFRRGTQP
jgi:Ca2+-binding EF-hand superfamily protein